MRDVFIYDAIRSARTRAKSNGGLHELTPPELLNPLYTALAQRNQLDPTLVSEVILGCVTQHGEQAGNIAKTSALFAGWPESVCGLTVHRFCSSSVDAIALAGLKVATGQTQAIVAGGVEMMSRVPMLSDEARVFSDPAYAIRHQMLLMGSGADLIATRVGASREDCDAVALLSQQRAAQAQQEGRFQSIIPIETPRGVISKDECIRADMTAERLAKLPQTFSELGAAGADQVQLAKFPELGAIEHVHTMGSSPAMCDAGALVLLGNAALGKSLGLAPKALLVTSATASGEPLEVVSGCVTVTEALLADQHLSPRDIDLFEIHEAFAATVVKTRQALDIDDSRLNVNGGVIALGHPMGATGAIMTGTLIDELYRQQLSKGIVAASGAAGSGSALLLERC
ncbi:MAG: acetyl-CoA C-acyltransferase [Pseudomonadota bacterium]|nr:acetyl-CoA C-acyltransferase [Pseudomonadota bacterium]